VVSFSRSLAAEASDGELRGSGARDVTHPTRRSSTVGSRRDRWFRRGRRTAQPSGCRSHARDGAVSLAAVALPQPRFWARPFLLRRRGVCAAALGDPAMLRSLGHQFEGVPSPVVELRADLASVSMVGHEDVMACLLALHRTESAATVLLPWTARWLVPLVFPADARRHPPTPVRLNAVRAFTIGDAPVQCAFTPWGRCPQWPDGLIPSRCTSGRSTRTWPPPTVRPRRPLKVGQLAG